MKPIFDHLRDRLHAKAGILPHGPKFSPADLKKLEQTEWDAEFERLMRNRMLMGALRYATMSKKGVMAKNGKHWELLKPIMSKLRAYEETGNSEYLVDIANYCMLAFRFDPHPKKHFHALDDHSDHCQFKK